MRRLFIAGNWKMNKTPDEASTFSTALKNKLADYTMVDIAVAPTNIALASTISKLKHSNVHVAAQNMHHATSGAYTGEISGEMIRSVGCEYVILGHSERRHKFGETDEQIKQKVKAAFRAGLLPILCIGETLEQRQSGLAAQVNIAQLESAMSDLHPDQAVSVTIAYEPVWAIGTGHTASPDQAQEIHSIIRQWLRENFPDFVAKQIKIQYGGSVKPHNAAVLLSQEDVDGALVGGAALSSDSFTAIIKAAENTNKV